MENAQLIGLSRQIALRRKMDVVAHNVANINTTGFKAEKTLFEEYVMPTARDKSFPVGDQRLSFTQDWATMHDMAPGAIQSTGNELDIALDGNGFIAVETPQGVQYTRNGSLKLDATGLLVTSDGHPVLSETGQFRFQPDETGITFTPDGSILTSDGNRGRMQLVEFENPQELRRAGNSLYTAGEDLPALPATQTRVVQGAIERSNVSAVEEMAEMISVNRAYQSVAQIVQRHDELRRDSIRRLGDLTA